ncbi:putative methionine biosynthesis protein MetW [Leptospira kirschneri str. 200803703]|uniref:class I SAM-dependent methyltransferase n=1 Tax=Leptospira kirschneri TaxID=29507 RepID=UPI00027846B1|nr:class I SAM-dependent methyltransferase [Leptospira kirschneri]EJO69938.1 putative methionine biosynthesis protein MetW [Leptospira kirschneri serovar Grippotyphosa str. RM52]EMJ96250.1 putative methionine biosynthesis protein MetW [Leptospira kirschneri str. JB]EMK07297.1 putative methionine biosynthesis protein MetW [Leptospira kirschneri str. MMD1493]EMK15230.1 putative methionine biosynthesis protein MetW [Leptospira kirschneri serovar Bim str. PUO 1247]EMN06800.1 putative methionine bi
MNRTCYLCSNTQNSVVFVENGIDIVQCSNCNHVFSTYEQEEHYEGYWDDDSSYDLSWWDNAHREIYQDFINKFLTAPSGKILDVGCGLGFFVKRIVDQKPNWEAIGYEISEKAVQFAKDKNGLKNVFSGIVQNSGIQKGSLDIITLWDVIEHIPKPHSLLEYLHSLLKPGGILFLQTPNFPIQLFKAKLKVMLKGMRTDGHYLEAKDHINDYTEKTMKMLAKQTGFQNCKFTILKPIASVSGSQGGNFGSFLKKVYYYVTKIIWLFSFKTMNLNNTLFAILKK